MNRFGLESSGSIPSISKLKESQEHLNHVFSWKIVDSKWEEVSKQWKQEIDKIHSQLSDLKSSIENFETWRKEKWTQLEHDSDPKLLLRLLKKKIELEHSITEQQSKTYSRVKFDVGGKIFVTSRSTLLSQKGSLFEKLLSEESTLTETGAYFLDRNPKYFEWILDFCRSGHVPAIDTNEAWNLWMEAQFYHLDTLSSKIEELYSVEFGERFQDWPLFTEQNKQNTTQTTCKQYTTVELAEFDGSDPKKPILLAVHGNVYDVSQSSSLYGKKGAFAHFAGKDATLIFLNQQSVVDYSNLSTEEAAMLLEWESAFKAKYPLVGKLIE